MDEARSTRPTARHVGAPAVGDPFLLAEPELIPQGTPLPRVCASSSACGADAGQPTRSSYALMPGETSLSSDVGPVFFEHEEGFWKGWKPSAEPDYPHFSFPGGGEVEPGLVSECLKHKEIMVLCDANTDDDGWAYAVFFRKLDEPRPVGRRVALPLDRVRRRCYVLYREPGEAADNAPRTSVLAPAPASKWRLEGEDREAIGKFVQWLTAVIGKRKKSDIAAVVLDPTVVFRLMRLHSDVYRESLEAACTPVYEADMSAADRTLLNNATRAAELSCAVYGAAMHEGRLCSITAFLQSATKHIMGSWNAAQNTTAFSKLARLDLRDVVGASWTEKAYEPAHVLAWDHERKWLVWAIRGSLDWRALLTDASAQSAEVCGGRAHEGMLLSAQRLLSQRLDLICEALREKPDYEFVTCGHSLGAGTAMVIALLLRSGEFEKQRSVPDCDDRVMTYTQLREELVELQQFTEEHCEAIWRGCRRVEYPEALCRTTAYGIGTPPTLTSELVENSLSWAFSTVRGMDFVSRLCIVGLDRLVLELTQASAFQKASDWMRKASGQSPELHRCHERALGSNQAVSDILMPPGRMLHIDTTVNKCHGSKRPPPTYWAMNPFYQRYLLGKTMLNDHLPREYFSELSLLLAAVELKHEAIVAARSSSARSPKLADLVTYAEGDRVGDAKSVEDVGKGCKAMTFAMSSNSSTDSDADDLDGWQIGCRR